MMKKTTASTKPTTNSIQAIFVAAPAIPVKPNTAAMSPMIRKIIAQLNIVLSFFLQFTFSD
jgi:hypothetical protein